MFRSYFKTAWRNLMNNKVFSLINIFGLTVGLTCCMFITMYLYHETRYDTQHKNIKRLYQVGTTMISGKEERRWPTTPSPLADVMKMAFPQIEATARIVPTRSEDKTLLQVRTGNANTH